MIELLAAAVPYLPASLGVLVLLLLLPLCGEVGRRRIALLFALGTVGMIVVAAQRAGATSTVAVVNAFPIGAQMRSTPVVTETVTAAGWRWPVLVAGVLGLLAMCSFAAARLASRAPWPALYCTLVGSTFVVLRLLLEKNAAPAGLAWAVGGSIGLPILLGFFGYYAGRRRSGFPAFMGALLGLALLQRALVTALAWLLTTRRLGTHLDVNAVTELNTPLGGLRRFGDDPVEKWAWAILVPQMVPWVAITLAVGLVVGGPCWRLARRQ
jgi:hypothetical protein